VELSGGQWQRLAILRGLAKPHEVLLVDEPTASIDPIEESRIFELVFSRNEGITLCVTIGWKRQRGSRIIVLKDGEVVGDGSHNELIVTNDYYNRLYMSQASMYESKP
jgi:ATP-binding cassette subfamily B protein